MYLHTYEVVYCLFTAHSLVQEPRPPPSTDLGKPHCMCIQSSEIIAMQLASYTTIHTARTEIGALIPQALSLKCTNRAATFKYIAIWNGLH